jgi:hypothetical protein
MDELLKILNKIQEIVNSTKVNVKVDINVKKDIGVTVDVTTTPLGEK